MNSVWLFGVYGILFFKCLEICYGEKSKNSNKSSVKTYFRHEPYGPQTYAFGFEVNDNKTSNRQFRDERRFLNGSIEGSYGYLRPDGRVTVTNFIADLKRGYLSQTRSFEDNSAENEKFWPTKKPNFLFQHPHDGNELIDRNVTFDEKSKMNLTTGKLHDNLTTALETQHGIEVNHIDLANDLLSPTLLDIINGKIPLEKSETFNNTAQQLGFKTFQNIIPNQFPIVPFELPQKLKNNIDTTTTKSNITESEETKEGKEMNSSIEDNTKMPKSLENSHGNSLERQSNWISMTVNQTRKEFLENLPNLLSNSIN